jgi:hypothetical protein
MNKYIVYITIAVCICVCTCGKEYTRLDVVFGEQPEGGTDVTLVYCIIVGRLVDGDTPIQARVKWHGEDLNHQNYMEYWSDTWTFRSEEPEELGAGVQAPDGYVLAGYFWFELTWEDEDETPHSLVSDTAECRVSVGATTKFPPMDVMLGTVATE